MTDAMKDLAGGNNDIVVPALQQKDELGRMASAVVVFKEAAIANKRLEAEAAASRQRAEGERIAAQQKAEADAAERLRIATMAWPPACAAWRRATFRSSSPSPSLRLRGAARGLQHVDQPSGRHGRFGSSRR